MKKAKQTKATKPAKTKQQAKVKATKQKQAKQQQTKQKQAKEQERNETIQERVERVAQSRAIYEELIEEGHERLLEEIFFWEGRAA